MNAAARDMPRHYGAAPFYVEAYRADGSQVLGNGNGQSPLYCRFPRRTALWKAIRSDRFANGGVVLWRIVDARTGRIVDAHRARMESAHGPVDGGAS